MVDVKDSDCLNDDLQEGSLYVFKKGVLQEIETDPDDVMKKVRITEDAYQAATRCQRGLRKALSGYRPDISIVCSALVTHAALRSDATQIVREYVLKVFQRWEEPSKTIEAYSDDE